MAKRLSYAAMYRKRKDDKTPVYGKCKDCVLFDGVKMCEKYHMITDRFKTCKSFKGKEK